MRVFVSWSGERSRRLARALRDWIPYVIHPIRKDDIWFSEADIEPGRLWSRDLGNVLADARIGLICLTHENRQAPWLHFEAGALAKHLDSARVIPVLYGLQPEDLEGSPLAQFQAVRLIRDDVLKMLRSLNSQLGESRVAEEVLERSLDHNWPDLETRLQELEDIKIEDMEALPGVIEVFSRRGLPEPHFGRLVHFEEGFESHTLYNILCDVATKRLLIFGRKNRKLFDKEHSDFLNSLPRRLADGFDFRCLFLSPGAPESVVNAAHADRDFRQQLAACVEKARMGLEQRSVAPEDHLRVYSSHRTLNLIIADDAVLFASVEMGPDGAPKRLTKCGFSVVDCRLSLGRHLLDTFFEAWSGATPVGGSAAHR